MKPRAVMDTNVLHAAFYSRQGASFDLFNRLIADEWRAVVSNHLIHEYEEILKFKTAELNLRDDEIDELLNAICARAEEWPLQSGWNPVLADPDDEPLVQLAFESAAKQIVTFNLRHLAPAASLQIKLLKPAEFLAIVKAG